MTLKVSGEVRQNYQFYASTRRIFKDPSTTSDLVLTVISDDATSPPPKPVFLVPAGLMAQASEWQLVYSVQIEGRPQVRWQSTASIQVAEVIDELVIREFDISIAVGKYTWPLYIDGWGSPRVKLEDVIKRSVSGQGKLDT